MKKDVLEKECQKMRERNGKPAPPATMPDKGKKKPLFECNGCGHLSRYHDNIEGCKWPGCKCKAVIIALTKREYQVLRLIASGKSNEVAGTTLGLATKTVEVHITNMRNKTGMHSTKNLILASLRCGILTADDLPVFDTIVTAA